jgi:phosphoglycolate phosphatase-like HAD superfamily hydrolase
MIEAVLCDIDGTLLQSNWLHAAAWKDAFADVPLEDVRRQIGKGGDELIPVFVPWWKRKAVEEPLKRYREFIFRDRYFSQVEPFPKVRELLLWCVIEATRSLTARKVMKKLTDARNRRLWGRSGIC